MLVVHLQLAQTGSHFMSLKGKIQASARRVNEVGMRQWQAVPVWLRTALSLRIESKHRVLMSHSAEYDKQREDP